MKTFVTGGGGFLGKAIVTQLLARGDQVRSFARGAYPDLAALGAAVIQGDIADAARVAEAMRGCDVVFHVAAKPGVWGPYEDYYRANVTGTENVIAACRANGVARLVYTSTPSVVFDGRDMEGANESVPYAEHFETHYPKTKAMAERLVLAANDDKLAAVALRPHLIWGPGDHHLIPRILARAGRLRIIGDGKNLVDTVYVDDAAAAHLLAADKLAPGSPIAGKAYFITQGEPRPLWEIINRILEAGGRLPVTKKISPRAAMAVGAALEFIYGALRIKSEPPMTRFVARELSTSHWFDISAARRDLGYKPKISFDDGMNRLAQWLSGRGGEKHDG
ncbi:NAD-dependent epimerase/dehydratase family protein [Candidatus Sumerlaeota bacterium]|nr:NAD-dependent epimerase/dehydratase family protein [Candidatus Sumerlaeota bacterium]